MSMVAPLAVDLREEEDDQATCALLATLPAKGKTRRASSGVDPVVGKSHDAQSSKTGFLIRTLPRDCNPTPMSSSSGLGSSASGAISPMGRRCSSQQETQMEVLQSENPFDDITERKLQQLAGSEDLTRVTTLQLSVDSTQQSVEVIGELLPALQQLRLQQSTLGSFRDLGTSLRSLRVLWAMHCGITDLDGIGALTSLRELYLQHNCVSDISPLTMHDELHIVDLEANCVSDMGQLEQLAFCPQLTALNLSANPVETVVCYRQIVANFLPQLTTLDDRAVTEAERQKLSDQEIDDAILAHRKELEVSALAGRTGAFAQVNDGSVVLLESWANAHQQYENSGPRRLSHSSSTASFNGAALDASLNDDSGSRLTHGTDIVFAGNVTSALRRHRCESEASVGDAHSDTPVSRPPSSHGLSDRPKTPARVSITDTLDRARELDVHGHKSRAAILHELKAWQLESAGVSQLGVTHVDEADVEAARQCNRTHRKGSVSGVSSVTATRTKLERRPKTSSGVLRNCGSVKEAFVDTSAAASAGFPPRPSSRGSFSKQRSSFSGPGVPNVDILILDGGDEHKRPCSPIKTSKGIFSTTGNGGNLLGRAREWNLEVLSPKVDTTTAKRHLPSSLTSKQQRERALAQYGRESSSDESDADSDDDDEPSVNITGARESSRPTPVPKATFFNVAESLQAIDKWRDNMEGMGDDADDTTVLSLSSLQLSCLSPREVAGTTVELSESADVRGNTNGNQHSPPRRKQSQRSTVALEPSSLDSDERLVQLLREKNEQLKTRDGFRGYFRGIEEERLQGILSQVFTDPDRVKRRMKIMSGFFRHELQD